MGNDALAECIRTRRNDNAVSKIVSIRLSDVAAADIRGWGEAQKNPPPTLSAAVVALLAIAIRDEGVKR